MSDKTEHKSCFVVSGGCQVLEGPWGPASIEVIMQRIRLSDADQLEAVLPDEICSGKVLMLNSTT